MVMAGSKKIRRVCFSCNGEKRDNPLDHPHRHSQQPAPLPFRKGGRGGRSFYLLVFSLLLTLILSACGGKGVEPEPEPRANHEEGDLVIELPGGVKMAFIWIEPGTFIMGSPESESGRQVNEGPQHEVTLTRGFYMGKYEVTQQREH